MTLAEIMASEEVFDPLTRFQCCPPTCGAGAAILCSDEFARKHKISNPVYIAAQAMTTDFLSTFEPQSMIKMVGFDQTPTSPSRSSRGVLCVHRRKTR
jgi:sterol carrier protein 2